MCNFDIITVTTGCCASMANVLFSLGNKIYITCNSKIAIHGVGKTINKCRFDEASTMEKYKVFQAENQQQINCYLKMNQFKMKEDELKNMFASSSVYYFNPSEAIEKGFATDIITDISQIM